MKSTAHEMAGAEVAQGHTRLLGDGALRAVELGLRPIPGPAAPSPSRLSKLLVDVDGVETLAAALASTDATGASLSVERLGAAEIHRRAEGGASVIALVEAGWIVVTGGHGRRLRAVLVDRGSERHIVARKLSDVTGNQRVKSLVLEPYLALEALAHRATGSKSPWARLRSFIELERTEVAALVVYAVALGALSLAVPIAVQVLVNTIAFGSLLQPLVVLAILLLVVLGISGLIQVVSWYAVEVLLRRVFVRTAEDFARRLVSTELEAHDEIAVPELVNRFFEVVGLQKSVGRLLLDGLGLVLQTAVGMALLAFYHPVLLAFDIVLVVALALVVSLGHGAVPTAVRESRAKYGVAAWLETLAEHPRLFASTNAGVLAVTTADALTRDYLGARRTHYRRVLRQLVGGIGVQIFALVALLGIGGWLVMRGELTLGQLVAAELVVGVIGAGFAKIGKHLETSYDLLASLDKLGKVVDLPVRSRTAHRPSPRSAHVVAHELSAAKGGGAGSRPVDLSLSPGARNLVVGRGGTGKSALLEVLAGLRAPASGSLRIDGLEVRDGHVLRERAWLLHPAEVVMGTVLDNLRLADPQVDEGRAWEVLRLVGLDERIAAIDGGLHAGLRSDGRPLSTSEAARLCAARALVAAPDLLLVDGGLDRLGLDDADKRIVLDALLGPEAPWAAVVVSDDPDVRGYCSGSVSLDPDGEKEVA